MLISVFPHASGMSPGFEKPASIPYRRCSSADAGVFESTPGSLGSSVAAVVHPPVALESLEIAIASCSRVVRDDAGRLQRVRKSLPR